jgi:hypothetical protein
MRLKLGSRGNEVRLIQIFLKNIGYNIKSTDGVFSLETERAVKQYQFKKNLKVDGIVGSKTVESFIKEGFVLSEERGAAVSPSLTKEFIINLIKRSQEFEGLVETVPNSKWDDPREAGWQKDKSQKISNYMNRVKGWSPGAPYCAAAVGAFVVMAMEDCKILPNKFLNNWTAHVMTNVRLLKSKNILSITPSLGSIWLAKYGHTDFGHTGVVLDIKGDTLITVEGNTSPGQTSDPSLQRAGDGIYVRKFNKNGRGSLRTQGFLSSENLLKFFVS